MEVMDKFENMNQLYYIAKRYTPNTIELKLRNLPFFHEVVTVDVIRCRRNRYNDNNVAAQFYSENALDVEKNKRLIDEQILFYQSTDREIVQCKNGFEFCGYDIFDCDRSEHSMLWNIPNTFVVRDKDIFTRYGLLESYENTVQFIYENREVFTCYECEPDDYYIVAVWRKI